LTLRASHALRRLLHVREAEEEQSRLALERALAERARIEGALALTGVRERGGRALVTQSARTGELSDRLAGMEEARIAQQLNRILSERLSDDAVHVSEKRENYLASRIARRQVETLIEEATKMDNRRMSRRSQQDLDEWFRSRA
jgi:flagellar biosynthesis chaperone FliJ